MAKGKKRNSAKRSRAASLMHRTGHFFDPALLESQFAALEEPRDALVVDAEQPVEDIVRKISQELAGKVGGATPWT